MLHAAPDALTHRESGIKHVRNDAGKALSRQAYYEFPCSRGNEKERTMIVEVHGMGFWTRVRFPPAPLNGNIAQLGERSPD